MIFLLKRIICYAMVLSLIALSAAPALAKPAPGDFADLLEHWAQRNVSAVCNLGLMSGMGENEQGSQVFSPDGLVNRAQLALVLQRTFELDYGEKSFIKQPQANDYYLDVDNGAWYAQAVKFCAINQVFDSAEKFYPEQAVTRIEVARAIHRCVKAKGLNIPMIMLMPYYQDMEGLSQEDSNALVFASNTSLMKGDGQNWRPQEQITRAELATVLNGLLRLLAVDESYDGQEYRLAPGHSFTLMLDSNPTTGYSWTASYDEKILALAARHYQQAGEGNVMGQGGKDTWIFKALQAGTTEIKMTYSRSWESVEPIKTFNLKIVIAPGQAEAGKVKVSSRVLKEKSDNMDVDLEIPMVSGLEAALQSAINQRFEGDAMELKQSLETGLKAYIAECKAEGYPIRPYQLFIRYRQCRLNDKVLSLYVDYYQYTGGAHGITERRAYNIDLKSGELLPLTAMFKPGYDYKAVIEQEIKRQIALNPEVYFKGEQGFKGLNKEQGYYLDGENLVLYFSQYEIAPYAAGIPEFKIPLELLSI